MLVLFAIVMTFCILGCFLPSMPLLLICVPIFVPLRRFSAWDLIWFGVIITVLETWPPSRRLSASASSS